MITVTIFINETPIYTRSAVNRGADSVGKKTQHRYELDDGSTLYHNRDDGAIPLVIEMLKGIHELRSKGEAPA